MKTTSTKTTSTKTNAQTPNLRTLEQRVANQERAVERGVKSGRLTQAEGTALKTKLEGVQSQFENDRFDGNGLSRGGDYAKQLGGIGKELKSQLTDSSQDLGKRMSNIDARIKKGEADGSLTADEASALKAQSATLQTQLSQATTPEAKQALLGQVDALSKQVHTERHNSSYDGAKRVASLQGRIDAGVADGSLNAAEAQRLTQRLDGMKAGITAGTASAKDVNGLSRGIFRQRHDANVDANKASQSLTQAITSAQENGTLSADQLSSLQAQLKSIMSGPSAAQGARLNALRAEFKLDVAGV